MVQKPLSKCQQCQQALTACRELLATDTRVREQLREHNKYLETQLEKAEAKVLTLQGLLQEAQGALTNGVQALRDGAADVRRNALANGAQPSWLVKDFNVLYRVALQYFDATDNGKTQAAMKARRALGAQLERLKSAFTDTEEVRALMRERQERL